MKGNFRRALAFGWPYKGRMMVSLLCSIVVAIFWGANISAIYPVLTVLLEKKTLVDWVDNNIAQADKRITELQSEITSIDDEINATKSSRDEAKEKELLARRNRRISELSSKQRNLAWSNSVRPYLVRYTPNDSFQTLCMLMLILIVGMLIKSVFDFFQEYLAGSAVNLAIFDLRNRFYRKTMNLDLTYFTEKGTHELMARFTSDVESLSSGMRALFGKVMLEPFKALSCLIFACLFNWRLTLITLLLFPAAAVIMGVIGRYLKRLSRRNLESMSRIYKILQESFLGIREVKAFTMERYERRRFFEETKLFYHQSMKLIRTDAIGNPLLEVLAIAAVAIALLAGSYLVMSGETHVFGIRLTYDPIEQSMLLTFYGLIAGLCDPLRKVFSVYGRVQRGIAASDRIFQCFDRQPKFVQKRRAPQMPPHCRAIEFRDVSFAYDKQRPVLKTVNLTVKFGETIAIVGSTGCGKTSLINLLPRFYDPCEGAVLIDGQDIRDVSMRSLRNQMGIVTQHTILFDDTIFNNISYGNRSVDPEMVRRAATAAYAHKFIMDLPHGYQTKIGELGTTLSGGQRQRIALARAILRDPAILILDEATSSLDVESESLIHKALRTFTRGRTTFVVTHRLSTLDIADRIVVVNAGRIEATGTHDELLRASITYRRLHDVQAKGA
ncbi:MAG: ABC transporter ATP-binding protein [Planctomycetota bacterium]